MHWYAAKTKTGQDHVAIENLRRQEFHTYYPKVIIDGAGRTEPLFPGYVLIRFEVSDHLWRVINNTRGVRRLLSFSADGRPSLLVDTEVEALQRRESTGNLRIPDIRRPRPGDRVRLIAGPSFDMIGRVVRTRGERVELLLHLLGRKVKCIAPEHTLEIVGGPHARR